MSDEHGDAAPPPPPPPPPPLPPPPAAPPPYPPYVPYPQAPGHPGLPQFPVYVLPDHPKATSALVVGIISVAGAFTCVLPILAAPVAWVLGAQARREIRNAPQQWGGDGRATAGMVLGIVGTVLLVLVVLALAVVVALLVHDPNGVDNTSVLGSVSLSGG